MKRQTRQSRPARARGTAAIELAVVLPLLLLIVLGCIDYGRVVHTSVALENAVGSGSDYATTHRFTSHTAATWEARLRERVTEEMQNVPNFDPSLLNIVIETTEVSETNFLVTVTGTYQFTSAVSWPGVPQNVTLRHRVAAWRYR